VRKLSNLARNYVRPFLGARERKGIVTVAGEIWAAYRAYGVFPEHYFRLALYLKAIREDVREYMPKAVIYPLQATLNGSRFPTAVTDKVLFRRIMQQHEIPCVAELFVIEAGGEIVDLGGRSLDLEEAEERIRSAGGRVFLKAVDGLGGQGAGIFDITRDRLADLRSRGGRCLVQSVIEQHPILASLYPGSVNTVRIDTLLADGDCHHNVAVLRLGAGGSVVDNATQGGLVVPIDLTNGSLQSVGRRKPYFSTDFYTCHPDTGVRFAAIALPYWQELLAVVRAGAEALRPLGTLGWDVAITPKGPLIVEANASWNTEAFQLGQGLRHTMIGQMALDRLSTGALGTGRSVLPPVTPADLPAARDGAVRPGR
jgi:hypothetical protein